MNPPIQISVFHHPSDQDLDEGDDRGDLWIVGYYYDECLRPGLPEGDPTGPFATADAARAAAASEWMGFHSDMCHSHVGGLSADSILEHAATCEDAIMFPGVPGLEITTERPRPT